jgi:hypothetical protein
VRFTIGGQRRRCSISRVTRRATVMAR